MQRSFARLPDAAVATRAAAVTLTALLLLTGCAALDLKPTPKYPAAPVSAEENTDFDYTIGPGDQLNVIVWRNPELTQSVPVRPDGKITTPLVEDLDVAGKTPSEVARDVETALAKYIQEPVVTVVVTSFVGPYTNQVRVIGEAARPAALPYRQNMTLMDLLIAVGGITEFAAGNSASIVRTEGGTRRQFGVRLKDLIKGGDITANVDMRPGDILIIPESFF